MSGIRFVHTDHLRLGSPIQGLAHAPEWLRRQACDAVRESVLRVVSVASSRNIDFLYVGGRCTECDDFLPSAIHWLKGPFRQLRSRGIPVVMTADSPTEATALSEICDTVIAPGQRLDVNRRGTQLQLQSVPAESPSHAELTVSRPSGFRVDRSAGARCHYLVDPGRCRTANSSSAREVYVAGSPQALAPLETGAYGCLVVEAHPQTGAIESSFESTDVLRFETRILPESTLKQSRGIAEAIIHASRQLAREEVRTMIIDWKVDHPVDTGTSLMSLREDYLLQLTRQMMQEGHVGIWPRRIEFCPTTVNVTERSASASVAELTTILFPSHVSTRRESALADYAMGAHFLGHAA